MNVQIAIALGLVAGLVFGLLAALTGSPTLLALAEGIAPLGTAFVNLFRMVVIPLVAATVFTGVATLGNPKKLGKMGGSTLLVFWSTTLVAIVIGIVTMKLALVIAPVTAQFPAGEDVARELPGAVDFLLGLIPANPFEAAASGALLPLVVFVVLFGAAAGALPDEQRAPLLALAEAITAALIRLVHWILWTAPVGVFALAAPMVASSGWAMLQSLSVFILAVAVGLTVFVAAVYMPLVVVLGGINSGRFIRALFGPVAIGAGATSSAAALPAMLNNAQQELGVSQAVAGLVLSLGAAINRAGSALFQSTAIIFLAAMYDVQIPLASIAGVVIATFLVSLTVAGVPSASLVTLAPAMDAAGVPLAGIGVLFGVDRIPDMLRTAVNITGHMMTTVVIEPLARESRQ